jgi:sacsin
LLRELDNLAQRESDLDIVKLSVRLLEALVDTVMSAEEQEQLLVPDANGQLRPISLVYFNDLGPTACFVSLPDTVSVAHPNLAFELAKDLGMTFIGHSELKSLLIDDHDMGEALTSRIHNVLVQYTVEQAFTEFIANAADAEATVLGILLDDQPAAGIHVLSPEFAEIQSRPSLIIYNNSVFDNEDFNGIRNVGVGGKVGKSNTIGQFGLGALSMYHFTDVSLCLNI